MVVANMSGLTATDVSFKNWLAQNFGWSKNLLKLALGWLCGECD